MIEAWKKFFGTGWLYGQEPSKQDCFKAGYEAALEAMKSDKVEKKTVPEIIKEWQDKFEGQNE